MDQGLEAATILLSIFGGISLVIWTSMKAKVARIKAEIEAQQQVTRPRQNAAPVNDAVLTELKALQQQVSQMQSTGHQFDIAFDAALSRLEGRVERLETKTVGTVAPGPAETQALRNGS